MSFNENIKGIRNMLKKEKEDREAIINQELVNLDENEKNLYLKVLCTVVQYENEPSSEQIRYLKRIVSGIGVDSTAGEFMKLALEITGEDIQEFLSVFSEINAKYYFAFDGLLLVSMENKSEDNYEYLNELIEMLEINKNDFEFVSLVAKSVSKQDSGLYDDARDLVTERTKDLNFAPYLKDYYVGAIVDTEVEKYYSVTDKEKSKSMKFPNTYTERFVTFENLSISLSEQWYFKGCERVVFKNCDLTSGGKILDFCSVGQVIFDGCKASDFTNRVAYFTNINKLEVLNSEFLNCGYTTNESAEGGVFSINNESGSLIQEIKLNGNKLLNCYINGPCKVNNEVTGVFLGFDRGSKEKFKVLKIVEVKNNIFNGCRCKCTPTSGAQAIISIYIDRKKIQEENNKCTGELLRIFSY